MSKYMHNINTNIKNETKKQKKIASLAFRFKNSSWTFSTFCTFFLAFSAGSSSSAAAISIYMRFNNFASSSSLKWFNHASFVKT